MEWALDEWFLYSVKNCKNKIIMPGSFGGNRISTSEKRIDRVTKYLEDISAHKRDIVFFYVLDMTQEISKLKEKYRICMMWKS